eukprot:NODE_2312_length_1234_cov_39.264135_g2107_i0.p1 GENE.NODE_2312_length_1234_cov_39.264135_g2107_i0~~NODE_2312_length_1234_cov_39.264135_g2107_i0.p1  ORF type:complete len:319 (-),score=58.06 NODE_2312_length_1234_cov_39.264135_g2107_i0:124-1080(-)
MDDYSEQTMMAHSLYGELLKGQSATITDTREHIQRVITDLQAKRKATGYKRLLLNAYKKDTVDSFADCRNTIKKNYAAIHNYLKQQEEEDLQELNHTLTHNLSEMERESNCVDRVLDRINQQLEEGQSLLQERDAFAFFAKGTLYRQLPPVNVPDMQLSFRDDFPDFNRLDIAPFQFPLHHVVQVDIQELLSSDRPCHVLGNIYHKGFRFQIQLKHDDRYLSAYLCLKAWHTISSFIRVYVDFTFTLQDGPQVLHSGSAKNTFEGAHDGWGWNKFIPLSKLVDCQVATFLVSFNDVCVNFVEEHTTTHELDGDTAMEA